MSAAPAPAHADRAPGVALPPSPSDPLPLAQELIRRPSITPEDHGAQDVLAAALGSLGFGCHRLTFAEPGTTPVENLYARLGDGPPLLLFAGHTDVVPPGDPAAWRAGPFEARVIDGVLHGRGAVDMKGAIACFVAATARFLEGHRPRGSIGLLVTGDEEGPALNGTRQLVAWLQRRGERVDACVVGEPTNPKRLGEMIKIGRRGSLTGRLTVRGVQGHVAYPDAADNPIPRLIALLQALMAEPLDHGSAHFQPSRLVPTTVDVGNPASNVIPAEARAAFNIRFNDRHDARSLEALVRARLDRVDRRYDLALSVSGEAFVTPPGPLVTLLSRVVREQLGIEPRLSTSGGTSDARFIKDLCPVVEFGLTSETIHQVNERVALADLEALTRVYLALLRDYVRSA